MSLLLVTALRSAQVRRISWVRGVVGQQLEFMASSYHTRNADRPLLIFKTSLDKPSQLVCMSFEDIYEILQQSLYARRFHKVAVGGDP